MRVIGGQWKSLALAAPSGRGTRPTTDRVKESIFNLLPHRLSGVAVDLFSGSGGLGIEALSRGAERVVFVDNDARAIQAIQQNLAKLKSEEAWQVWRMDWKKAIANLAREGTTVDWLFVDPPYARNLWNPVLDLLSSMDLRVQGSVVCEMPKSNTPSDRVGRFVLDKYRVYGDIAVGVYVMTV